MGVSHELAWGHRVGKRNHRHSWRRGRAPASTLSPCPPAPTELVDARRVWHRRSEPRRAAGGGLGAEAGRGQVGPVSSLPSCRRRRPPSRQGPEPLLPQRPHLLGRRQDARKPAPVCKPGVAGSAEGAALPLRTLVPAATRPPERLAPRKVWAGPDLLPCSMGERVAVTGPGGPVSRCHGHLSSRDRAPGTWSAGPFMAGSVSQVQPRRGGGKAATSPGFKWGRGLTSRTEPGQRSTPGHSPPRLGSMQLHLAELGE